MCEEIITVRNFINGKFTESERYLPSYEPATGKVWAQIPDSDVVDVERAVQSAKNAFPSWAATSVTDRANRLRKVADLLEERLEEFAIAEARDQGKPVNLAKNVDIPRAVLNFRHFAETYPHALNKSSMQPDYSALNYTMRSPIGIAGLISPWNLPLYLLTFKIAPALIAGNTVVCKPSEMTSVTAWKLCSVFIEAGIPPGVVNMVFGVGKRAGEPLVAHPDVSHISFTGSTAIGRHISTLTAPHFKKLSLELGGKNCAIIFDDADYEKCLATTIKSSFLNQGEICLSTSRLYVHGNIFDKFLTSFIQESRKLVVGPSLYPNSDLGALISQDHLQKVRDYVNLARQDGATIHCGEGVDTLNLEQDYKHGYFMRPTVVTGLPNSSRCMQEEIFGPVVCLSPFADEDEVIRSANDVKYGLCATVWTRDHLRLTRIAKELEVGTVWGNCWMVRNIDMPFGGTKMSGIGREGTQESLEFYTEIKTVCLGTDWYSRN